MTQGVITALRKIGKWLKYWLWQKPITEPEKEAPVRLKATEVANEFVVINYHGQRINLHYNEVALWRRMSRKDKRKMSSKFARLEKEKKIVFAKINGKEICVKNKDYEAKANILK
jgi:hypothetical protein